MDDAGCKGDPTRGRGTGDADERAYEAHPLARNARLYDQAARLAKLGAWECDLATERLTWTDGVYDLFELPLGASLKRSAILDLYAEESRSDMETVRAEVIRSGRNGAVDARIRTCRGALRWMRLSIDIAYENDRPVRLFGAKQDITLEKESWVRLRQMAERDPLTGLANRALFDARYRKVVRDELNHDFVSALALMDLDHFKQINDGLGHAAGDECLRRAAERLQHVLDDSGLSDGSLIARIGGDEFAVLLRAPLGPGRIRRMLRRASDVLCKPIVWNGQALDVGASIGATIFGRPHLRKLSDLFAEADEALYVAKAAGRKTVHVFGDEAYLTVDRQRPESRVA